MKRFTETCKWSDPWFRRLSPIAKLAWVYLTDNCDCVGMIEPDLEAMSFYIGAEVTQGHMDELGDRVEKATGNKLIIPKFIQFQYGKLSKSCPPHKGILKLINQRGLTEDSKGYHYPTTRVAVGLQNGGDEVEGARGARVDEQDEKQEEAEDREKQRKQKIKAAAVRILEEVCRVSGRQFLPTDANLSVISARLLETKMDVDGILLMVNRQWKLWQGAMFGDKPAVEFFRPQTLFAPKKFDGYYAARLLEVQPESKPPAKRHESAPGVW